MEVPVRKPVTRSKGRVVGYFASYKNRCLMPWESQFERDFLMLLEVNPEVLFYRVQPRKIPFWDGQKTRKYTPDVFVRSTRGETYYEVKSEADASKPANQHLFEQISTLLADEGYGFEVVTEKCFRKQPNLDNAIQILAHRVGLYEHLEFEPLFRLFDGDEALPLEYVSAKLCSTNSYLSALKYIAAGYLRMDMDLRIQPTSKVSLFQGGKDNG